MIYQDWIDWLFWVVSRDGRLDVGEQLFVAKHHLVVVLKPEIDFYHLKQNNKFVTCICIVSIWYWFLSSETKQPVIFLLHIWKKHVNDLNVKQVHEIKILEIINITVLNNKFLKWKLICFYERQKHNKIVKDIATKLQHLERYFFTGVHFRHHILKVHNWYNSRHMNLINFNCKITLKCAGTM